MCTYEAENGKSPCCTHDCNGCVWHVDEENSVLYHVSCDRCGHDWWDETGYPKKCPKCHKSPYINEEAIEFAKEFMSDAVHETAKQFRQD